MKRLSAPLLILAFALLITGCLPESQGDIEESQLESAVQAIVKNQPPPDLGGYSFERQIVIETYLARNSTIATYAYMFSMDGKIVEICPSIGYPIPYSTQLTNPQVLTYNYVGRSAGYIEGAIANPEPNGVYPPDNAAATLVQCVNPDGSVSPTYIEWYVLAFPYRIASDYQIQRIGDPSFSIEVGR